MTQLHVLRIISDIICLYVSYVIYIISYVQLHAVKFRKIRIIDNEIDESTM